MAALGAMGEISASAEPEKRVVWEAAGPPCRLQLEIAEKGWGTNVSITAAADRGDDAIETFLEQLLEELASPERRPFSGAV